MRSMEAEEDATGAKADYGADNAQFGCKLYHGQYRKGRYFIHKHCDKHDDDAMKYTFTSTRSDPLVRSRQHGCVKNDKSKQPSCRTSTARQQLQKN